MPPDEVPLIASLPAQPDFGALCARREARARELAERHPATRQALEFYAEIAAFQACVSTESPLESRADLVDLVLRIAPDPLAAAARDLDPAAGEIALSAYRRGVDTESPQSFFARVLLGPAAAAGVFDLVEAAESPHDRSGSASGGSSDTCPRCGHAPQACCSRTSGDGTALSLSCSLCLAEWDFPRARCAACGGDDDSRLAWYGTDDLPQLQVRACDSCHRYLHTVSMVADAHAVPDVDEIAALPLDVWASERGYRKLRPNLVGL